jgi:hypothetical protein
MRDPTFNINQSPTTSHLNVSKWRQQLLETSRFLSLRYVFFFFFLLSYSTNVISLILKEFNLALTLSKLVILTRPGIMFVKMLYSYYNIIFSWLTRNHRVLHCLTRPTWQMGKEVVENILFPSAYMRLIFGLEERVWHYRYSSILFVKIEHSFPFSRVVTPVTTPLNAF